MQETMAVGRVGPTYSWDQPPSPDFWLGGSFSLRCRPVRADVRI